MVIIFGWKKGSIQVNSGKGGPLLALRAGRAFGVDSERLGGLDIDRCILIVRFGRIASKHSLMRISSYVLLSISLVSNCGCALVTSESAFESPRSEQGSDKNPLPPPKMNADGIQVDTALIPIIVDDEFWQSVDEGVLNSELREILYGNGLRAGRLIGDPAQHFDPQKTDPSIASLESLESAGVASELKHVVKHAVCRPGNYYAIPTRAPISGEATLLLREGDKLTGVTLQDAAPSFEFAVALRADRQIALKLRPVVEYGQLRNQWLGESQAIRLKLERERVDLRKLAVAVNLPAREVFVIGASRPLRGLGKLLFFGERADGETDQTVLLFRCGSKPNVVSGASGNGSASLP
jgi:hypothetical protein